MIRLYFTLIAIHTGKFLIISFLILLIYEAAVYLFYKFKGDRGAKITKNELRMRKESKKQKSTSEKVLSRQPRSEKDPNGWKSLIDYHPKGGENRFSDPNDPIREVSKSNWDEETQSLLNDLYSSDMSGENGRGHVERGVIPLERSQVEDVPCEESNTTAVLHKGETMKKALSDFDFSNMVDL